jgi:hypothetical protein
MAIITEDLVQSSVVSSTGVSNWDRTTASDDSKASFSAESGTNIIFELTNLSQTPTSIVSVQQVMEVNAQVSQTAVIANAILNGSNTQLYTENLAWSSNSDNSVSATTRTTSDGSTAWTENDINTMRIKCTWIAEAGPITTILVDHYFVRVIYNVPDPTAGLIKLNSGMVKLNSGHIKMIG